MIWGVDAGLLMMHLVPVLTIWREASGEGREGMIAVAWVIRNRMTKRALSAASVCLQPYQFSSMTAKGDPGMTRFVTPEEGASAREAFDVWMGVLKGTIADPTGGADFYFNPSVVKPAWASAYTKTCSINHHDFYRS